jgi:WD40 repeat protein
MKHKNNGNLISLFAMLFMAFSNSLWSAELDTVWVSDINGQVLFQHPVSKNILIANNGITELFSNDGKFVRSFPFDVTNAELSPDGNKILHSFSENIYIYDYAQTKPIEQIDFVMYGKFLTNDMVVYRHRQTSNIIKYNLNTKEKVEFDPPHPVTALATSPNGKYIAYATFEEITNTESKAHLYLLDAETMQGLGDLGSWDSPGQDLNNIRFSKDSKYLTYSPSYFQEIMPVHIYDLATKKVVKTFTPSTFPYYNCVIGFLNEEIYLVRGRNLGKQESEVRIYNFLNDELLYKSNDFNKYIQAAVYESAKNYLYCNTPANKTFCFDLNNIISGIEPVDKYILNVLYINKILEININNTHINNIEIYTIEGRKVFETNKLDNINNNKISIPISLDTGFYIINIQSEKFKRTFKLLVKE